MRAPIFLLALLTSHTLFSQSLRFFGIDDSEYPNVKASFYSFDNVGNRDMKIGKDAFDLKENSVKQKVISVTHPAPGEKSAVSVILVTDVSGSMSSNSNLSLAQSGIRQFLNHVDFSNSECALTSFENVAQVNVDFSADKQRLSNAVAKLKADGGTNYDGAFNHPKVGAFSVASRAAHKPVIVFLTDGQGTVDESSIIAKANAINASVYTVALQMQSPECLKTIARSTGGINFDLVDDESEIVSIYDIIFNAASGLPPSTITWESVPPCSPRITTQLFNRKSTQSSEKIDYQVSIANSRHLSYDPLIIELNAEKKSITLSLEAAHGDITLTKAALGLSSLTADFGSFPIRIQEGQKKLIEVNVKEGVSSYEFGKVNIQHNCGTTKILSIVDMGDGVQEDQLEVQYPNGDEVLMSGSDEILQWTGGPQGEDLLLSYSKDSGKNWRKINVTNRGSGYEWEVPVVNTKEALFKVEPKSVKKDGDKPTKTLLFDFYGGDDALYYSPLGDQICMEVFRNPRLYDALTGEEAWSKHYDRRVQFSFSRNGLYYQVEKYDGQIEMFNSQTHEEVKSNDVSQEEAVDSYKLEKWKDVYKTDAKTNRTSLVHSFEKQRFWIGQNGNYMFVEHRVDTEDEVEMIDIRTMETVAKSYNDNGGYIRQHTFSMDGRYAAIYEKQGPTAIFDLVRGKLIHTFDGREGEEMFEVSFAKNLVMCNAKKGISIFDLDTGDLIFVFDSKYQRGTMPVNGKQAALNYENKDGEWMVDVFKLDHSGPLKPDQSDRVFTITAPNLAVSDMIFPTICVNTQHDRVFQSVLKNKSTFSVDIQSVSVRGKDSSSFQVVSGLPRLPLASASNMNVELRFSPMREGLHEAVLLVQTNYGIYEMPIRGEAIELPFDVVNRDVDLGKHLVGKTLDSLLIDIIETRSKGTFTVKSLRLVTVDEDQFEVIRPQTPITKKNGLDLSLKFKALRRGKTSAKVVLELAESPIDLTVMIYAEVIAPKVYDVNYVVKSKTTKQVLPLSLSVQHNQDDVEWKKDASTNGQLSFELPADHLYDVKAMVGSKDERKFEIDLRIHQAEKLIEKIIWIDDEIRSDLPDIIYAGDLLDKESKRKVKGKVVLLQQDTKMGIDSVASDSYEFKQPKSQEILFYASAVGYFPQRVKISIDAQPKPNFFKQDIELEPVVFGKSVKLENVLFVRSQSELLPGSEDPLDLLVDYLKENSTFDVELAGHTDNKGSISLNQKLSQERVETIRDYLINQGINKKRISGKGYGGSKPIASNKTEETRRLNRRVEFKIIQASK